METAVDHTSRAGSERAIFSLSQDVEMGRHLFFSTHLLVKSIIIIIIIWFEPRNKGNCAATDVDDVDAFLLVLAVNLAEQQA